MQQGKPANSLQMIWITSATIIATGYYSLLTVLSGWFFKGEKLRRNGNYIVQHWSAALLKIIKAKYKVFNPHNINFEPGKPYIIMCNHNSLYDIPLSFMGIQGTLRMVAKKELSKIPIFGPAMRAAEFVFIDRKNRDQAVKDLETAKQKMASGIMIWLCPEGTRSHDGQLLPLKRGGFMMALQTGATIIPLGFRGTHELLKANSLRLRLNHDVEMHLGKPIDCTRYTKEQRKQLMLDFEKELKLAAKLI